MKALLNARLLDPASGRDERGSLLIADGRILALGPELAIPEQAERIDCKGQAVMPGLIDMRAFAVDAASALAGGITTVILMPDRTPPLDNAAMIANCARPDPEAGRPRVRPMGAATQGLGGTAMAELGLMAEAGAVGFTDGRRAIGDTLMMRRLLEYSSLFDLPIVQHAEDPSLAAGGVMNAGETATRLGLPGIPDIAETIMIERDARLLELGKGRLHIAQISARRSLDAVRDAKARGLPLSVGISPQHFLLNETAVGDYRTFCHVSPPLRSEADRHALVAAIGEGLIDVICSGHDPRDQDAKRLPFSESEPGIVGFETLLPLALALHHNEGVPLLPLLGMLTAQPAAILGLEEGRLAPGAPADVLVVDLERPSVIDPGTFRSETQNTPFEGQPVQGKVLMTIIAGEVRFEETDR
ncbi:MAG: dihydroorotase [Rhodothalassiaceae bacterium]